MPRCAALVLLFFVVVLARHFIVFLSLHSFVINGVIPPDEYAFGNNSVYTNVVAAYALQFAAYVSQLVVQNVSVATIQRWLGALFVCVCCFVFTRFSRSLTSHVSLSHFSSFSAEIANGLKIPFSDSLGIHLEYDGYSGATVKQVWFVCSVFFFFFYFNVFLRTSFNVLAQADVVLLAYPLQYPMSAAVQRNDLVYYSARTDPNGPGSWCLHCFLLVYFRRLIPSYCTSPHRTSSRFITLHHASSHFIAAMTWGMTAIGWLELGNTSAAQSYFLRSFSANLAPPFSVWMETPQGGASHFVTGAAGFVRCWFFFL